MRGGKTPPPDARMAFSPQTSPGPNRSPATNDSPSLSGVETISSDSNSPARGSHKNPRGQRIEGFTQEAPVIVGATSGGSKKPPSSNPSQSPGESSANHKQAFREAFKILDLQAVPPTGTPFANFTTLYDTITDRSVSPSEFFCQIKKSVDTASNELSSKDVRHDLEGHFNISFYHVRRELCKFLRTISSEKQRFGPTTTAPARKAPPSPSATSSFSSIVSVTTEASHRSGSTDAVGHTRGSRQKRQRSGSPSTSGTGAGAVQHPGHKSSLVSLNASKAAPGSPQWSTPRSITPSQSPSSARNILWSDAGTPSPNSNNTGNSTIPAKKFARDHVGDRPHLARKRLSSPSVVKQSTEGQPDNRMNQRRVSQDHAAGRGMMNRGLINGTSRVMAHFGSDRSSGARDEERAGNLRGRPPLKTNRQGRATGARDVPKKAAPVNKKTRGPVRKQPRKALDEDEADSSPDSDSVPLGRELRPRGLTSRVCQPTVMTVADIAQDLHEDKTKLQHVALAVGEGYMPVEPDSEPDSDMESDPQPWLTPKDIVDLIHLKVPPCPDLATAERLEEIPVPHYVRFPLPMPDKRTSTERLPTTHTKKPVEIQSNCGPLPLVPHCRRNRSISPSAPIGQLFTHFFTPEVQQKIGRKSYQRLRAVSFPEEGYSSESSSSARSDPPSDDPQMRQTRTCCVDYSVLHRFLVGFAKEERKQLSSKRRGSGSTQGQHGKAELPFEECLRVLNWLVAT